MISFDGVDVKRGRSPAHTKTAPEAEVPSNLRAVDLIVNL